MRTGDPFKSVSSQRGVIAVTLALVLTALVAMAAIAVDVGSLFVVRNELQNAADAGALAATRVLYTSDGQTINTGANAIGVAAAQENNAQNVQVELIGDPANNTGDVQRGHWRWTDRSFTPNASTSVVSLANVATSVLDDDMDFINAVRVRVRRQSTPASSYFARVLGFDSFQMQAEAVAYIGFAGTLLPGEADQPIAICQQSLLNGEGNYSCNTGRMINSGGGETHNTGGWANFTQEPCETASTPTVRPYAGCDPAPSPEISLGVDMGTSGGEIQNVFDDVYDCWRASHDSDGDGRPDTVMNMSLVVIDCPSNNVGNCSEPVGGVNVNVVWMIRQTDPNNDWVPLAMSGAGVTDWACPSSITLDMDPEDMTDEQFLECWQDFTTHFGLVNYLGTSIGSLALSELNKTMFFLPDCQVHVPAGGTGGRNFGVLAKIPVLVD